MTERERESFRRYIPAERTTRADEVVVGELNPIYREAPVAMNATMNDAETKREEFMGKK